MGEAIYRQCNPMELVTIKGVTKRTRKPRSLSVEELQKFIQGLEEPFRTIALTCVCFGLRISDCLALKWSDITGSIANLILSVALFGSASEM
jgi:integrase